MRLKCSSDDLFGEVFSKDDRGASFEVVENEQRGRELMDAKESTFVIVTLIWAPYEDGGRAKVVTARQWTTRLQMLQSPIAKPRHRLQYCVELGTVSSNDRMYKQNISHPASEIRRQQLRDETA